MYNTYIITTPTSVTKQRGETLTTSHRLTFRNWVHHLPVDTHVAPIWKKRSYLEAWSVALLLTGWVQSTPHLMCRFFGNFHRNILSRTHFRRLRSSWRAWIAKIVKWYHKTTYIQCLKHRQVVFANQNRNLIYSTVWKWNRKENKWLRESRDVHRRKGIAYIVTVALRAKISTHGPTKCWNATFCRIPTRNETRHLDNDTFFMWVDNAI